TVGFLQSFNGRDTFAARFVGQIGTGADGRPVNQDGAGAANLDFAGNFSAVEIQGVAQNFGKRFLRLAVYLTGFAVQSNFQFHCDLRLTVSGPESWVSGSRRIREKRETLDPRLGTLLSCSAAEYSPPRAPSA